MINISKEDLKKISIESFEIDQNYKEKNCIVVRHNQEIKINSSGHRGPEFSKNIDLLIAGCSQTNGVGIPENKIWGNALAIDLGLSYNNLSYDSGSIFHIINNIFKYIEKYGKPKTLLCLFPDFYKIRVFIDKKYFINNNDTDMSGPYSAVSFHKDKLSNVEIPTSPQKIIPLEMVIMYNFIMLARLEKYCKLNNIKYLFSTWYIDNNIDETLKNDFDCYISLKDEFEKWQYVKNNGYDDKEIYLKDNGCHEMFSKIDLNYFDLASDKGFTDWAHMGTHKHIHIKDIFKLALQKNI
jgi:hypothetical protein